MCAPTTACVTRHRHGMWWLVVRVGPVGAVVATVASPGSGPTRCPASKQPRLVDRKSDGRPAMIVTIGATGVAAGRLGRARWSRGSAAKRPGRSQPLHRRSVIHPQWTRRARVRAMIQTPPRGRALVSGYRHGPLRNSGSLSDHKCSHNVEDRGTSWETIKAVAGVSAGHGLDLLRARRDSNP